jgi:hypothetical protein
MHLIRQAAAGTCTPYASVASAYTLSRESVFLDSTLGGAPRPRAFAPLRTSADEIEEIQLLQLKIVLDMGVTRRLCWRQ